jgi:hypothetical protein
VCIGAVDNRITELEYMNETGMNKHLLSLLGSPSHCTLVNNKIRAFFLGGRRGTRTPKHFVNITEESKNFS